MTVKRNFFLLAIALVMLMTTGCGPQKNGTIEPITIDASNIDEYLMVLPEYDKITVYIDKSRFSEEVTDDYIEKYYERLASGKEGLTDEEGNLLPLSDETVKLLDIPAFSDLNEFKVFVRGTVEDFVVKENNDKKIDAALEIIREDAAFADIPENYVKEFADRVESDYEELAAKYGITAEEYVELSEVSLEDEAIKAAKNELIFIKMAERLGLEYQSRDEMVDGVTDYLLGIIRIATKKK